MNITLNKLSINQLFNAHNEQFVIPAYQRRYAWGYNQYAALLDDIQQLHNNEGHLFGMLIIHTSAHTGGLNKLELVDGQQRITTLTLLLLALKNTFGFKGKQDKVAEIEGMLQCKGYDDVKHPKLLLGDLDNADFLRVFSGTYTDETEREKIQNLNIVQAYEHFLLKLSDMEPEELMRVYFMLTNVAISIRLDVHNIKDAYKLFETINNRGLRLSPTDIIKNFLLGHAAKLEAQKAGTLEEVKKLWAAIIVNLDKLNTDDFLRQYMCGIIKRKLPLSRLVNEFKNYYLKNVEGTELLGGFVYRKEEDTEEEDADNETDATTDSEDAAPVEVVSNKISITDLLKEIGVASAIYKKIHFRGFTDVKINKHIGNLQRILSTPSYIYLMFFFQKNYPNDVQYKALKMIETFMLRRHICENRTSEHDDIFAKLCKFEKADVLEDIKAVLLEHLPSDAVFSENFPTHSFKGILENRAKYVLEYIEYHITGNTNEYTLNAGNDVHLEHIIPQTITTKSSKQQFGDWETYLGDNAKVKHTKYVRRIGNLTLLSGVLNIKASNNPFGKKKKCYSQSNIELTKRLATKSDFKFKAVEDRGRDLSAYALAIWNFN